MGHSAPHWAVQAHVGEEGIAKEGCLAGGQGVQGEGCSMREGGMR